MLKETRKFIKEHKIEIVIGGIVLTVGGILLYKHLNVKQQVEVLKNGQEMLKNNIKKNGEIAREALRLHIERIDTEIELLQDSIDRLNPEIAINKFHNIPERMAKIEELATQRSTIVEQLKNIEK